MWRGRGSSTGSPPAAPATRRPRARRRGSSPPATARLARQGSGAKIELRASWTPADADVTAHVEGWGELLCMLAGLPPAGEGVTLLSARRTRT
ncbi:DUF3000 family protein [Clavibacter tessellarius]|uniref:DUF3000 family protein n=1 Tax=Clavibacter tessellarius TaxID=31965 RepID=UPI00324E18DD